MPDKKERMNNRGVSPSMTPPASIGYYSSHLPLIECPPNATKLSVNASDPISLSTYHISMDRPDSSTYSRSESTWRHHKLPIGSVFEKVNVATSVDFSPVDHAKESTQHTYVA